MKVDRQLIARAVEDAIPRISSVMRPDIADAVERAVTVETSARGQQVLDLVRKNARIACDDMLRDQCFYIFGAIWCHNAC